MDKVKAAWRKFEEWFESIGPERGSAIEFFRRSNKWVNENILPDLGSKEQSEFEKEFYNWWNTEVAKTESEMIGDEDDVPVDVDTTRSIPSPMDPDLTSRSVDREDYKGSGLPGDETYGISNKNFNKFSQKYGYNVDPDLINDEILRLKSEEGVDNDIEISELIEYQALMQSDALVRPAYEDSGKPILDANGNQYFLPFQSHFDGIKISDIIDSNASSQEIEDWQSYLIRHNIVPNDYFIESQGVMSEKLRASIKYVMTWLDQNRHVVKGTDVYANEIEGQDAMFFTSYSSMYEEADYHRNLIGYALKEMAAERVQLDKAEEAKIAEQLLKEYIPPRKENLEEMVEAYFEQKLNRKPTAQELSQWAETFSLSYDASYAQARAQAQQLSDFNFMNENPQYFEMNSQREQFAKDYPGMGYTDLSQFSINSPEDIMQDQLDAEFGEQEDDVERGKAIRQMQSDLIKYMFGG
tara:strand:+ start:6947 stop:8350 length:1404 start_codon:yes stop_codon:yes gene_type:complete